MATRARGMLSQSAMDAGWPYLAEISIPGCGLGQRFGPRHDAFLAGRDWRRGRALRGAVDRRQYHFRHEADADAFVAAFPDLDARRVELPPRRGKRKGPYDFS